DPRWVPLNEALARRELQTGTDELALADLREMVPRAYTMRRSYDRRSDTTRDEILTPQFWRDFDFRRWRLSLRIKRSFPENTILYVWGPDLEEIWPPAAPASKRPTHRRTRPRPAPPHPPPRRRGPATPHDWFSICGEIARRCINRAGCVQVPKSEAQLADDVLDWLAQGGKDCPATSELREAVRRVCAPIRTAR